MMKSRRREMPIPIEVPDAVHERLRAWAEAAQVSEEQVITDALDAYLPVPWPLREEMQAWQSIGAQAIEKVAPAADEAWRPASIGP
jgi:predicted transcriptional regulator